MELKETFFNIKYVKDSLKVNCSCLFNSVQLFLSLTLICMKYFTDVTA